MPLPLSLIQAAHTHTHYVAHTTVQLSLLALTFFALGFLSGMLFMGYFHYREIHATNRETYRKQLEAVRIQAWKRRNLENATEATPASEPPAPGQDSDTKADEGKQGETKGNAG